MALKTFVKVSGINNLSDARYCSGMGVDQLGFSIEENSPNYTDPDKFKEIKNWLSGVAYVGELDAQNETEPGNFNERYELDAIQVSNPAQVVLLEELGLPIILKMDVSMITGELLASLKTRVDYFLIESAYEEPLSADILALAKNYPLVSAYGFDSSNVAEVIELGIKGIALQGGNEIGPGLRDFDEMMDILEVLEIDDTLDSR